MALGALTAGTLYEVPNNIIALIPISLLGDGAYPSGGTATFSAITAVYNALRGKTLLAVIQTGACGGYLVWYDKANDKLLVYQGATGLLVPTTTADLSGVTLNLLLLAV